MKTILVSIFVMSFLLVSCEQTDCQKATENYMSAQEKFTIAEGIYNSAVTTMESVCSIYSKNERAIDLADACQKAKQGVVAANIAFSVAKSAMATWKTIVDQKCQAK